ncbi:hypothetical protein A1A1_00823 [Planococcus antarcticus DSM 14505]|uniref:Uncharacterized protein n=1 Tax=Planococcus antarcticus DSM 14505 TaxID=1185653 RepID=A0AA87LWQ8_9BACL|nr:DUF5819 family protein [Planococcus antarcticus]EIM08415.1 hypothetical protein A1A1_00823 [Planococcus antarcticus DSM 14505]
MKNNLLKIWFYLLLSFVIFHSSVTIMYNFPSTPLKERFESEINSYIEPLFTQTWTLFAPNPVSTNVGVEVKMTHNNNTETQWISFSELVHEESQKNFFSHYQFYANALIQMQGEAIRISEELTSSKSKEEEISSEISQNSQIDYVEQVINREDISTFLEENGVIYSLYGFIYTYFENNHFDNITHMQIRLSSEFFSEYGKKEESKYMLFYLPKIQTNQLLIGGEYAKKP